MATRAHRDKVNALRFSNFKLMGDRRKERNERRRQKEKSRGKERREGTKIPWLLVSYLQGTASTYVFLLPHNCINCIGCFLNMFPLSP